MKQPQRLLVGSVALLLAWAASPAALAADRLADGFSSPPDSAKPQTWWHWMNGNITKEGITADLEAMKKIGLGGATIVNVDCGIPRGPVNFMSPRWRDDLKFAVAEADRLGFKLCVENCAGWSSSGGPWNTPENAMQRLTSSETRANGPAAFDAVLAVPQANLKTYRDIAVLAFKEPVTEETTAAGPANHETKLEVLEARYESVNGTAGADAKEKVVALIAAGRKSVRAGNAEFGPDPAAGQVKRLRLEFMLDGKRGTLIADENDVLIFPLDAAALERARKASKTSIDRTFVQPASGDGVFAGTVLPSNEIIDLTSKLAPDGRLKWDVPPGKWVIFRVGYTPIGVENHPSPTEGLGLECDKLSKAALDAHWAGFMQKVLDDVGPLAGKALDASLIDSYEVGGQDWTPAFREEFTKRRGYDPIKFLVTQGRYVIDSPAVTERFLWDMRRTVADLFADNYWNYFTELCHKNGLNSAVEPYTGPFESLQCGSAADVVMGEFWTGSNGHPSVKMAASIAHIYGKSVVAAESFTAGGNESRWTNDPYSLKALGDLMFCQGLNRYVFHRYAMQPWLDRKPGMTMGEYGLNFERTQTWWEQGKPWVSYISRCEFLLQQGRAVADVAYYTGESAPVEMRIGTPEMPAGYDYDAVNSDVLLHGATVEKGRLKLSSGASYAVLILPADDANMTPAVLECVDKLVRAGATVVGPRPTQSPSLAGYPDCDARVKELADALWGACDGKAVKENAVGQGRVVSGQTITDVFGAQKLMPDFEIKAGGRPVAIAYTHRISDDSDLYFVSNQMLQFETVDCTFRVTGKVPQLWHADTGAMEPAPVWSESDGRTTVRLSFAPSGSVFVVFRPTTGATPGAADRVVAATSTLTAGKQPGHNLKITRAVFAAIDGSTESDVTAKVAAQVADGNLSMDVSNTLLGPDPAVMREKQLRVSYTLDGKAARVVVKENQKLVLPTGSVFGEPPLWEPVFTATGRPAARVWGTGVVELQTASGKTLHAVSTALPPPTEIGGAWRVSFPPNLGAPASVKMESLASWTESADPGVRYFSGTATYETEFDVAADRLNAGREVWLDLGTVKNFAEVAVNGQDVGLLWKPPFRVNVTAAVKPGVNQLTVKITNLWPNRLIGDEQLPPDVEWNGGSLKEWPQWLLDGKSSPTGRITFTTWHHWDQKGTLLESGLIGPVTVRTAEVVPAK